MNDERRNLLVEKTLLPDDLDERLHARLAFLIDVDRLKSVLRQLPLTVADHRDNDAKHSWHRLGGQVMILDLVDAQDALIPGALLNPQG